MAEEAQLTAALNLMRRMPPAQTEANLTGLLNLMPDLADDLLQRIDQPLKLMQDAKAGKQFVLCDYNRDGDSYRCALPNCLVASRCNCRHQSVFFHSLVRRSAAHAAQSSLLNVSLTPIASSPWSNAYFPAIEDGFTPSAKLRSMEIEANALFDVYRQLCVLISDS